MNTEQTIKRIYVFAAVLFLVFTPLCAEKNIKQGMNFNGGLTASYMTFFTYENIGYKIGFYESQIEIEGGVRLLENFLFDPYFYYCPYIQIYAENFYLGAGFLSSVSGVEDNLHTYLVRLGWLVGNWQMGKGTGNMDIGVEISPTIFFDPYCKYPGSGILEVGKSTVANMIKLNVGFNYYLPF